MTLSAAHPWIIGGRIEKVDDLLSECENCGKFSNIAGYECPDPFAPLTKKIVRFLCPCCNDMQLVADWYLLERACNDPATTQMLRTGIKV